MRLTYRTARVLGCIAERPGASNRAVAERAGVTDPGQISKLLRRLEGLGLAVNTGGGHLCGEPNAWQLTALGGQVAQRLAFSLASGGRMHDAPLRSIYRFTTSTKENRVKFTEHTAKPASASKTGRFASLRGPHRAQGSGAPARRLLATPLTVLCAFFVLLALSTGTAQAEPPKLVLDESFSAQETHAVGVAVEGSGDLFVSGLIGESFAPSSVVKLGPSGTLLSPPSPFGSGYYSGVAVNPANGDVYVLGQEGFSTPTMIFVYDPNTGALLSSFEVPSSRNDLIFTDVQIAADSAGNVYVPVVPENKVLEYSPSGTLLKTFTGSGAGALKEPRGVAVDSSGNLWVADSGNGRIVELDSSGAPVEVNGKPVEIESEGVGSVALDGHGDVFAVVDNGADPCGEKKSPCLHLVEYSSEGRQLADVGAGFFGEQGGAGERFFSMVAVSEASGRVYVTDGVRETVWVFGPPVAPVVYRELTAEVGVSEAKLGALVNPGGIETTYRFEYGTTTEYGSSTPFPEGSVGEGVESHAVWASANGLAPGSTYHYRIVATNELGTIYGPDQTFTTLSAEQAACPNEQLRGGFSGKLPDCRAYELVTPPVTSGSQFDGSSSTVGRKWRTRARPPRMAKRSRSTPGNRGRARPPPASIRGDAWRRRLDRGRHHAARIL